MPEDEWILFCFLWDYTAAEQLPLLLQKPHRKQDTFPLFHCPLAHREKKEGTGGDFREWVVSKPSQKSMNPCKAWRKNRKIHRKAAINTTMKKNPTFSVLTRDLVCASTVS